MDPVAKLIAAWPRSIHCWRTVGHSAREGFAGYGLLHKPGRSEDHRDFDPPVYSAIYVLRGRGRFRAAGVDREVGPGSVFQRIPGRRHSSDIDPASGWVECYVAVGPRLCHALAAAGLIDERRLVIDRGLDPFLAGRICSGITSLGGTADEDLPRELGRLLATLADLLAAPAGTAEGDAGIVSSARQRLGADLDVELSPRRVARDLGCGYERFRKLFQRATGQSPARYRMRRRIDRARELLLDPEASVAEVARAVGFADPFLFSARFRAHTGTSPSAFRKGLPAG
jgi:AraC-like DNA-binding protein